MQEERRVVSTMQETFLKQIAELSRTVGELNMNMRVHRSMMEEIREDQKAYRNVMILIERNSNKVDEALKEVAKVNHMHSTCNINKIESDLSVVNSKVSLIFKVLGGIGVAFVPIILKLFM